MLRIMFAEYIQSAMKQAEYEITEDKRYFGKITAFKGVWAEAHTLEQCREELCEVLEEWIILSLKKGESLPVIDMIDLNRIAEHA